MSHIVGAKLASGDHNHRVVQEAFRRDDEFKLSQEDIIMFPMIENMSTVEKQHIGHWYAISLDLKYQRFEVLDSMRSKDDLDLRVNSGEMVCHIKSTWAQYYGSSKKQIKHFPTGFIEVPQQFGM